MANVLERGPSLEKTLRKSSFTAPAGHNVPGPLDQCFGGTLKKSSIDPLHTYVFSQHPSADEVRATSHRIKALFQAVAHSVAILKVHQTALQDSL